MKKKEMLAIATNLQTANDTIDKSKLNQDDVVELLTNCQELAILLGTNLESKYGVTHEQITSNLVQGLEDYCEKLYHLSLSVSDAIQTNKWTKKIKKQLLQLINTIKYDIPDDKKEIVFLPYKASMWDSLESVWKKADADKDCDAYVIPIPYFDKNPDGTFGEEHYEGDQYPDYVPITSYKEYNIEERKPDVIYIHNPYDECNFVTSVHPSFYSEKLKKYTESLIYIPYFVLREIKPDDWAAVENMKHFCVVPGVFHADKVIVQSEDMRQVYINVLTEETGGTSEMRRYWEAKIDGSGSPKFDKVKNTKREELEIPEEWLEIINKPDGQRKKIVFYNNSVTALLQNDEEMITKMQSVFQTFKENRDEVALLWRPHPLIESTLTSMRPQLWEKYRQIRDDYLTEGWGIYDDTPDVDRAIVLSDAYYGDPSSIVQMYQLTGKPIMIQNPDIK